jgi:hypothetical protein
MRVVLSCAIGNALYPHRQWQTLAGIWKSFYPTTSLDASRTKLLQSMFTTMPRFIRLLIRHQPRSLRGLSLGEAVRHADRHPDHLLAYWERWRAAPRLMKRAPPTLLFAVFGRARVSGRLTPETENRLLGNLITHWALSSTLEVADLCARQLASAPPYAVSHTLRAAPPAHIRRKFALNAS